MILFENIWWLLVLIAVMIMIHELGHYWAARFFKIRVMVFSLGFGHRLFGFQKGGTDFRLSWIPFGGYVRMAGEHPTDDPDPNGFLSKPRWQRLIVVLAGPAMNIVLAIAVLTGLFMIHYPKLASAASPAAIGYVKPDSPASRAGIREGDIIAQIEGKRDPVWEDVIMKEIVSPGKRLPLIVQRGSARIPLYVTPELDQKSGIGLAGWAEKNEIEVGGLVSGMDAERKGLRKGDLLVSINGRPVTTIFMIHEELRKSDGAPVHVVYRRAGKELSVTVQPSFNEAAAPGGRWMMGIELAPRMIYSRLSFPQALRESFNQNIKGATLIYQFLQALIERRSSPKSLEGPIRIAQLSGDAAREGPSTFFSLMATISLNLAIFNLLPIPILDGGMILMLLIEMFIRRDLSARLKEAFLQLGLVFLMMVVVFVLYNDLSKIFPG